MNAKTDILKFLRALRQVEAEEFLRSIRADEDDERVLASMQANLDLPQVFITHEMDLNKSQEQDCTCSAHPARVLTRSYPNIHLIQLENDFESLHPKVVH